MLLIANNRGVYMKNIKGTFGLGRLMTLLLAALLVLAFSQVSFGLRCGNHVIQMGDPMLRVIKACGEPDLIISKPYTRFGADVWQYDRGKDNLMTSIKFVDGEVQLIKFDGGYGF